LPLFCYYHSSLTSDNKIGSEGAQFLADAFKSNTSITSVDLACV
jgi:hypothetical protein